jgi:hypothetical protein
MESLTLAERKQQYCENIRLALKFLADTQFKHIVASEHIVAKCWRRCLLPVSWESERKCVNTAMNKKIVLKAVVPCLLMWVQKPT